MTWTERERELLGVTLSLLQQNGYDGLTVDDVAAEGHASKATMYRRWPTKAELVLAAVIDGITQVATAPDTGTLRGDLLDIGDKVCKHAREHATTIRAVLVEVSRNPDLNDVLKHQLFDERKALMNHILQQAVDRGEIADCAINTELWDLLPGYLIYRAVIQNRMPTRRTVQMMVDDVIIPSLTRHSSLTRHTRVPS